MKEITYQVTVNGHETVWRLNGKLHREDGPAIECSSGSKYWYFNGKLHRVDGLAIEYSNGSKCWYLNGKLHREDDPATECSDGKEYWYLNGKPFSRREFLQNPRPTKELTIKEISDLLGYNVKIIA